jgi:hypothetical protein
VQMLLQTLFKYVANANALLVVVSRVFTDF